MLGAKLEVVIVRSVPRVAQAASRKKRKGNWARKIVSLKSHIHVHLNQKELLHRGKFSMHCFNHCLYLYKNEGS